MDECLSYTFIDMAAINIFNDNVSSFKNPIQKSQRKSSISSKKWLRNKPHKLMFSCNASNI